jgi:molybdenum cofactor biosynthesis enzyme MoaA
MLETFAEDVEWLQITGGEPTLSKPLSRFLRSLINRGLANSINLLINTNAVNVKEDFLDIVRQFQVCVFSLSVDGHGELDEYIRFPTQWNKKETIIKNIMAEFSSSSICMTINSLNINMFNQMFEWGVNNCYRMHLILLINPEELSFRHMPEHMKDHARGIIASVLERLSQIPLQNHTGEFVDSVKSMLNYLDLPRDELKWQQCLNIVRAYDTIRDRPLCEINTFFKNQY